MAKRKRAKLIRSEGNFKLGFIDIENKRLIELWEHNGFYYQLTKKYKIECNFTEYKEFIPTISRWLDDLNNIYRSSRLTENVRELMRLEA